MCQKLELREGEYWKKNEREEKREENFRIGTKAAVRMYMYLLMTSVA